MRPNTIRRPGVVPGSTAPLDVPFAAETASLAKPWTPAQGRGDGELVVICDAVGVFA